MLPLFGTGAVRRAAKAAIDRLTEASQAVSTIVCGSSYRTMPSTSRVSRDTKLARI